MTLGAGGVQKAELWGPGAPGAPGTRGAWEAGVLGQAAAAGLRGLELHRFALGLRPQMWGPAGVLLGSRMTQASGKSLGSESQVQHTGAFAGCQLGPGGQREGVDIPLRNRFAGRNRKSPFKMSTAGTARGRHLHAPGGAKARAGGEEVRYWQVLGGCLGLERRQAWRRGLVWVLSPSLSCCPFFAFPISSQELCLRVSPPQQALMTPQFHLEPTPSPASLFKGLGLESGLPPARALWARLGEVSWQ